MSVGDDDGKEKKSIQKKLSLKYHRFRRRYLVLFHVDYYRRPLVFFSYCLFEFFFVFSKAADKVIVIVARLPNECNFQRFPFKSIIKHQRIISIP